MQLLQRASGFAEASGQSKSNRFLLQQRSQIIFHNLGEIRKTGHVQVQPGPHASTQSLEKGACRGAAVGPWGHEMMLLIEVRAQCIRMDICWIAERAVTHVLAVARAVTGAFDSAAS